ncbi:hypothetical protein AB8A21_40175 [Streptomyces sp. BF23-18]|uniref:hypothetical protein n=1 Tax=Streptomyces sp. BF23-18 TaxID=3240282 RepID=UPI0034E491AE
MNESVNPYQMFIDVLAHRYSGEQKKALTGEFVAAYSEVNHLLARTKGKLPRGVWSDCAAELERCVDLYRSAWREFASGVDDYVSSVGSGVVVSSSLGPDTTQAFQAAVDGLCVTLASLRREASLIGCESWKY